MFGQFETNDHEDNKGLFTFYREQAEKQQQIRRLKKQRKLAKIRQQQQRKRKQEQANNEQKQIVLISKQFQKSEENQQKQQDQRTDRFRKNLYQPKNRRQKFNKQQLGTSVVIVNSKQINDRIDNQNVQRSRSTLRKIEEMINPHNNNRYFLQNKEMPSNFGKVSLEKLIVKNDKNQDLEKQNSKQKKNAVKPSYFNDYAGQNEDKKYIPTFSYQKLPQLLRNKPANSEMILPRRYKSKKVEAALKSNNSELIRQIRQSLKQQSILEKVSYIDASQGMMANAYGYSNSPQNHVHSFTANGTEHSSIYQQEYETRLNSQLDSKQRRLIEIIRNSSNIRKKKYM